MKELLKRKKLRLEGYDYSNSGVYFVTICVINKHELLGEIVVNDADVGDAVLSVPKKSKEI